jgi:ATP-dependent Clp endopeptidase proteolytic subunit ClpP
VSITITTVTPEEAKATAEASAAQSDAHLAEFLAKSAGLAYQREKLRFDMEQGSDWNHRVFRFSDEINPRSVAHLIESMSCAMRIDRDNPRPYTLYITSPGGLITPGISLHSFLKRLADNRPLTTVVSGFAASMATVVSQAGTHRQIEFGSTFLVHNASGVVSGETHSIQDQADWMRRMNAGLHRILAEKSRRTEAEIAARAERRDWNMTSDEALEHGFVDEVV